MNESSIIKSSLNCPKYLSKSQSWRCPIRDKSFLARPPLSKSKCFKGSRGVEVIITAQLYSTKPELRFCAGSNPARGVLEICDGKNLRHWSRLEIRLNIFRRSTIPQKQFIIIIVQFFSLSGVILSVGLINKCY